MIKLKFKFNFKLNFLNASKKTLIKYFLDMVLKNKISLIIMIISFIGTLCLPFFIIGGDSNLSMVKHSVIFIGVPLLLLLVQVSIHSIVLFSSTKGNNVDLYLNVHEVPKNKMVILKQLAILLTSANIVIALLLSFVIESIIGVSIGRTFAFLFIQLISLLLLSFIWISVFSAICIFWNQMAAIVATSFISMIFVVGSFLPILFSSNKIFTNDYDVQNNQKTIARAISVDNNGHIMDSKNIIYENALAKNEVNFDYHKSFLDFSPLNISFGIAPIFSSSLFSLSEDQSSNLKNGDLDLSSIYLNSNITNFIPSASNENMILSKPGLKTIFDYNDKTKMFADLKDELLHGVSIESAKNTTYIGAVINALKANKLWNVSSIDSSMKSLIKSVLGIENPSSLSFPIFENYNLAKDRISGFYDYLALQTSKEFANLVEYLWTDSRAKDNVYEYNSSLLNREDLNRYHPTAYSFDSLKPANKFDVDFVKSGLFNVETDSKTGLINNFQILDNNSVFQNLKDASLVSPVDILKYILNNDNDAKTVLESLHIPNDQITTKAEFDKFVDAFFKSHTANNLIAVFEKINNIKLRTENTMDSNYFKNDNLFKITSDANGVIERIEYKDDSSTYKNLVDASKSIATLNDQLSLKAINSVLGTNLTTLDSWNDYIDQNNTINNLENIIRKIQSMSNGDSYQMVFRNNIKNFMSIISEINLKPMNRQNLIWLYLLLGLSISGGLQYLINRKMTKGDIL